MRDPVDPTPTRDATAPRPLVHPAALPQLTGTEPLAESTVLDFWRWALGDLRMNTARGYLAEYLVANAVGDRSAVRVEWGPWDVQAADGTLIEVKAAGRLQSWASRDLTPPKWTFKAVRADRVWSDAAGAYLPVVPRDRVHVWVFALQTAEDPNLYDPLDTAQWEFRVIAHRPLLDAGQASAGPTFFDKRGIHPVPYEHLAGAIRAARETNETL